VRPHDDVCAAGVEPEVVLKDGQHARVVRLADDATATQHHADAGHAPSLPRTRSRSLPAWPASLLGAPTG
jgi:hypothetical protein